MLSEVESRPPRDQLPPTRLDPRRQSLTTGGNPLLQKENPYYIRKSLTIRRSSLTTESISRLRGARRSTGRAGPNLVNFIIIIVIIVLLLPLLLIITTATIVLMIILIMLIYGLIHHLYVICSRIVFGARRSTGCAGTRRTWRGGPACAGIKQLNAPYGIPSLTNTYDIHYDIHTCINIYIYIYTRLRGAIQGWSDAWW